MFGFSVKNYAQISPGDLSDLHSHLEGISNCTKCHHIGGQVRNQECLDCHSDIKKLQNDKRGYHASNDVIKKKCIECHSEHHGRNFRIVNINSKNFNHEKTGFLLSGKHSKVECSGCHKTEFMIEEKSKKHKGTFMGLHADCRGCHQDYHQTTLGSNCEKCHSAESFRPATKFNHDISNFALSGAHIKVECVKCHIIELKNGKNFQRFKNIEYKSCNSCHQDIHKGKFGNDCNSCHVTESFKKIKNLEKFDHAKTNYPLLGKHQNVKCTDCHKGGLNTKPKYEKCINCHSDYHVGEFTKNNYQTDCGVCHDVNGFSLTSFSTERHKETKFLLTGSHLAIPCQSCHQKNNKWKFRIDRGNCINCHRNVHGDSFSKKIYDDDICVTCHNSEKWNVVSFNHKLTGFELLGVHQKQDCRKCHLYKDQNSSEKISFRVKSECTTCHKDIHAGQFTNNDTADCARCHHFDNWKPDRFDHNKSRFKLEGAHLKQPCYKCHKTVVDEKGKYIKYKFDEVKCATCHS